MGKIKNKMNQLLMSYKLLKLKKEKEYKDKHSLFL